MSLTDRLLRRIRHDGPISVAEYMTDCLTHPTLGYYTTRDPLGLAGDFVTAPEISQMFGELLGLALAQSWLDQGSPARFVLAELGPGRGTLMADILRATRGVPGFHAAAELVLVEASPVLRAEQAQRLAAFSPRWLAEVTDLPDGPLWLVANEFFDALPIRQFVRDGDGWRERRVGADRDRLAFGLGPVQRQPVLDHRLQDTAPGDLVEHCPAAAPIMAVIGDRIARQGGAGLIVDYGDWRLLGDTLQAVRAHKSVPVLEAPGQCDLTAHVDFEALVSTLPCAHSPLTPQGVFLERLGIAARAQALAQRSPAARQELIAAHRRLTHPDEMGNLFKVIGLHPAGSAPPPGLAV
jgi:SAM-dependent MidA family methyltransferase